MNVELLSRKVVIKLSCSLEKSLLNWENQSDSWISNKTQLGGYYLMTTCDRDCACGFQKRKSFLTCGQAQKNTKMSINATITLLTMVTFDKH